MLREDAIAWLRSVGRNASARDWSMGETILITIGEPQIVDGISVYPGIVYLCPTESGRWNLLDLGMAEPVASYADLTSAARAAHAYVARKELIER